MKVCIMFDDRKGITEGYVKYNDSSIRFFRRVHDLRNGLVEYEDTKVDTNDLEIAYNKCASMGDEGCLYEYGIAINKNKVAFKARINTDARLGPCIVGAKKIKGNLHVSIRGLITDKTYIFDGETGQYLFTNKDR